MQTEIDEAHKQTADLAAIVKSKVFIYEAL